MSLEFHKWEASGKVTYLPNKEKLDGVAALRAGFSKHKNGDDAGTRSLILTPDVTAKIHRGMRLGEMDDRKANVTPIDVLFLEKKHPFSNQQRARVNAALRAVHNEGVNTIGDLRRVNDEWLSNIPGIKAPEIIFLQEVVKKDETDGTMKAA